MYIHFKIVLKEKFTYTKLGLFLAKKSVNRAEISRKTGLSEARLSLLSGKSTSKPRADEIYLIALAIDVEPAEILSYIFKDLKLKE